MTLFNELHTHIIFNDQFSFMPMYSRHLINLLFLFIYFSCKGLITEWTIVLDSLIKSLKHFRCPQLFIRIRTITAGRTSQSKQIHSWTLIWTALRQVFQNFKFQQPNNANFLNPILAWFVSSKNNDSFVLIRKIHLRPNFFFFLAFKPR